MRIVFEYSGSLSEKEIQQKMMELSEKVGYHFQDISWLKRAFYTEVTTKTNREKYANSPMATLGDRVLSLIITEDLFDEGETSEKITTVKADKEGNSEWFKISTGMGLCYYAFNDKHFFDSAPKHEQLPKGGHDRYFEALIGAIYKDSACFEDAKATIQGILKKWGI